MRNAIVLSATLLFVSTAAFANPGDGKPFGAPDPAVCPVVSSKSLPQPAVLAKLVQCHAEGRSGSYYRLYRNLRIQAGSPHTGSAGDGDGDIDYGVSVYPIVGTYLEYACEYSNDYSRGHNCTTYNAQHASGECWYSSFGKWRCRMGDTTASDYPLGKNVAPPKQ